MSARDEARADEPMVVHEFMKEGAIVSPVPADEREAFEAEGKRRFYPKDMDGNRISGVSPLAAVFVQGAEYGASFRRQGTITDAKRAVRDAIVAEQKRIAALPDTHKTWTGEQGRAWQNGMSNAIRIAESALEAAEAAR